MQGDPQIIEALNKVLKNTLTAINQYFLHARMFRHWGLEKLNDYQYKQSIRVMKEADELRQPRPAGGPAGALRRRDRLAGNAAKPDHERQPAELPAVAHGARRPLKPAGMHRFRAGAPPGSG